LSGGAGLACEAATAPTDTGTAKCSGAVSSGTTLKTGWLGFTAAAYGLDLSKGGSPLYGTMLCPQPRDVCDSASKWGDSKMKTFADASAAAVEVTIKKEIGPKESCSYVIEATCDAPYMQLKGTGTELATVASAWTTAEAKLTYTVMEWFSYSTAKYLWESGEASKFAPASRTITNFKAGTAAEVGKLPGA